MRPSAFTIIEILVVLLLVAMLATLAALSLRGPKTAATMEAAIDQAKSIDRIARDRAKRSGEIHALDFDLDHGTILARRVDENNSATINRFGASAQLASIWFAKQPTTTGKTSVQVQPSGTSRGYALTLTDNNGTARHLLFIGATGQVMEVDDESKIKSYFTAEALPQRDDTD